MSRADTKRNLRTIMMDDELLGAEDELLDEEEIDEDEDLDDLDEDEESEEEEDAL